MSSNFLPGRKAGAQIPNEEDNPSFKENKPLINNSLSKSSIKPR